MEIADRGGEPATPPAQVAPTNRITPPGLAYAPAVLVMLITLAAYLPALWHGFAWDDDAVLLGNPHLHPAGWAALLYYLAHPFWTLYMPITAAAYTGLAWISGLIGRNLVEGLNPALFHLAGIASHAATAGLLQRVLQRIVARPWIAAGAALVFALHPVQVEAVAFAGGLDNTLCGLFSLGAACGYLRFLHRPNAARSGTILYAGATAALLMAILSKPTAVVVPVIVALLAMAGGRGTRAELRRILRTLLPWLIVAGMAAVAAAAVQPARALSAAQPLWLRPLIACNSIAFYVGKVFWPARLCIDYGRTPTFLRGDPWIAITPAAPLLLLVLAAVLWQRRQRAAAAAIGIFTVALLPNSGLLSFDFQFYSTTADRYAYLAMIGVALAVGVVAAAAARRWNRPTLVCGAILLLLLLILQQRQLATWRSAATLFHRAVTINPNSWWCWGDLARADLQQGRPAAAAEDATRSVQLQPDSLVGWELLGLSDLQLRQPSAAMNAFAHGLALAPNNALALQNYLHARAAAKGR